MRTITLTLALLTGLGLGCSGGDDDSEGSTAGSSGFDNPLAGTGAAGGGAGSDGKAGSGTGSLGGEDPDTEICRHVDMIISVDGSSSMTEELQAIRDEVFPAFADRLTQISGGIEDYRVATLDACPNPANYHTRGQAGECNFAGGNPWIDSFSPTLRDEFQCVGDLFQGDQMCSGNNDDEQPASAIAKSLEREFASGANAGFSRHNALLVAIAITDEDEQPTGSAESAQEVYERIVKAKGGDPKRIVFLGIGGRRQCLGTYGTAEQASKLRDITQLFEQNGHGVFWDLCQGKLADGLESAYKAIEAGCNDLPPPPTEPPPLSDGPE
jgi:hypothetical protein